MTSALSFTTTISEIKGDTLLIGGRPLDALAQSHRYRDLIGLIWKQDDAVLARESAGLCAIAEAAWRDIMGRSGPRREPFDLLIEHSLTFRQHLESSDIGQKGIPLQGPDGSLWALGYALLSTWTRQGPACQTHDFSTALLHSLRSNSNLVSSEASSELFDLLMLVHAENELNFSTVALRLGARAGSDFLSSVTAALSVLRGHRHGGAAAGVMAFMESWETNRGVTETLRAYFESRRRIPGFGHLIFRGGDPRVVLLKTALSRFLAKNPQDLKSRQIFNRAEALEAEIFREKKLRANVDFYAGIIYLCLGIPKNSATAIFAMSRLMGWVSHFAEETGVS